MAFTEAQKTRIRFYLGYPDLHRYRNTRLEDAILVVGDRPATQALVEEVLTALETVETSVEEGLSSAGQGGLKRVEDIEWYQESTTTGGSSKGTLESKRQEGRAACSRLSIIFGVELGGDAFGRVGYEGDQWMGRSTQYGGSFGLG